MWSTRTQLQPQADVVALEANVARAGLALACPYSTSDEYEAAVIQARRDAGAYGGKQRHMLLAAAAAAAAILLLIVQF